MRISDWSSDVCSSDLTPMPITLWWPTTTPSTTSERAPMKQWSSMIVGEACNGSSTPPIPAPPERWQCLPTWAQEPTVAQVRSEERRVGKECVSQGRYRGSPYHEKKKKK